MLMCKLVFEFIIRYMRDSLEISKKANPNPQEERFVLCSVYQRREIIAMLIRHKLWHEPVCCRTSPWRSTWDTTGKTRGYPSPAPTTRAWRLTAGWWRRSGSLTCSLCTPSAPSSTTPPRTTSCCGSSQMGRYFIASGKTALGQCELLVVWNGKCFNWFPYLIFAWLHTQKNYKYECIG